MRTITKEIVEKFRNYLLAEEKALATLEKYVRDVRAFFTWLDGRAVDKNEILSYKTELCEKYSVASVNSVISALNTFFQNFSVFSQICFLKDGLRRFLCFFSNFINIFM